MKFFFEVYFEWISERPSQLAAALAYYGLFSLAPVIYLAFSFSSLFIDRLFLASQWYALLNGIFGPEIADFLRDAVLGISVSKSNRQDVSLVSVISFLAILYSASALFFQLELSLNKVFHVQSRRDTYRKMVVRKRVLSFVVVIGVSLMLMLNTLLGTFLSHMSILTKTSIGNSTPGLVLAGLVSLAIITLSFAILYKALPDVHLPWRDIGLGAFLAALLIVIAGKLAAPLIHISKGNSMLATTGSLAIFLITFYVFAQFFLLGAVIAQIYARLHGSQKHIMQASPSFPVQEEN